MKKEISTQLYTHLHNFTNTPRSFKVSLLHCTKALLNFQKNTLQNVTQLTHIYTNIQICTTDYKTAHNFTKVLNNFTTNHKTLYTFCTRKLDISFFEYTTLQTLHTTLHFETLQNHTQLYNTLINQTLQNHTQLYNTLHNSTHVHTILHNFITCLSKLYNLSHTCSTFYTVLHTKQFKTLYKHFTQIHTDFAHTFTKTIHNYTEYTQLLQDFTQRTKQKTLSTCITT